MNAYSDAIEAILDKSVMLSPEFLDEIDTFIETNEYLGYATREGFIHDVIRFKLVQASEKET